uniref:Reverse transcriptase zinc-binding domain-containing protein n=1 Tax=Quercus lobata TaxID=97700 RepID=A0A7N2KQL6_QUELO
MGWLTRFLGAVAFLAVGVIFSPETFGSKSDGENSTSKLAIYLKLAHLLCYATAFGTALWVTFIGGIIMFKNLPRHQFGNLQSKMFPAYFSMVGICCAVSVGSFAYLHPWKSSSTTEKYQLGFLLSAFAFNLANLLVFTPMTIESFHGDKSPGPDGFPMAFFQTCWVSHLLFADDTLIFCDADLDQILILRMILIWFEAVSGLKINLGKSELVPVGVVHNFDLLLNVLGYKQGSLPMKYLGLPLGANFKDKTIWNPIPEKMERKLAGWKHLYLSKGGIRKISLFNIALLGKWLWRFGIEKDALWRQVIEMKYERVSLRCWFMEEYQSGLAFFLTPYSEASVAELMKSPSGVLFWDVSFFRGVHVRELEALSSFMESIYGFSIRGFGEDKMCWIPSKDKGFLVKDYYRILAGSTIFGFPWRSIWKQKIPSRVAFFVWTAALGKYLTIDNLRKRKVWILDWCYMCKSNGESVDHLFLHCPVAMDLWSMVLGLFGVSWFRCSVNDQESQSLDGFMLLIYSTKVQGASSNKLCWKLTSSRGFDMMKQRHKVERESNIGEEVGWSKNVEVAKVNPKLKAMNKKFGMIHGLSSLANIMSFGSLAMHSWYLAGKLNL